MFAAGQWQGPFEGERGGKYWISPSGEKSYEGPQGDGGSGTGQQAKTSALDQHSASTSLWSQSSTSLDSHTAASLHSNVQSIADEPNPEHQAGKLKSFVASLASLPAEKIKSAVTSLIDYGKAVLKSGARVVGAVGLHLGGIAVAAGIIAAATLIPGLLPASIPAWSALAAALPIGVGIKKLLTATSKASSRVLRGPNTPGVSYGNA